MSLPSSTDGLTPYRKPRPNVYTVLLGIALAALLIGILCLYLEMEDYEWKIKGGPNVSAPSAAPRSSVSTASALGAWRGGGGPGCAARPSPSA